MNNVAFQNFTNWWKQPFNMEGDATDWILFSGFIIAVIFLWTRVLKDITSSVSEL